MSRADLRTHKDLREIEDRLMPPNDREAFLREYGKIVGPILDAKLEAKAREMLERYATTLASVLDRTDGTIPRDSLLCTREEAAKLIGVSLSTIKRMEASGELPEPIRFGERQVRHRLIDVEEVARYNGAAQVPTE